MDDVLKQYKIKMTGSAHDSRLDKLLTILATDKRFSVDELGEMFGCSSRTIYRLLKDLEDDGVAVDLNNGRPRIFDARNKKEIESVFLSADEVSLLIETLQGLSMDNPFRQSLSSKLGMMLRSTLMPYFSCNPESMRCVSAINNAMINRKQLYVLGYASSNSGSVGNRLVEPVKWSANYRQVQVYDVDKRAMRTFVVNRMQGTELTAQDWMYADEHCVLAEDCFWMTGEELFSVTLHLNLRALNLLHEEYPLSTAFDVSQSGDSDFPYKVTLKLRSRWGLDRFVKGLEGNVYVVQ